MGHNADDEPVELTTVIFGNRIVPSANAGIPIGDWGNVIFENNRITGEEPDPQSGTR